MTQTLEHTDAISLLKELVFESRRSNVSTADLYDLDDIAAFLKYSKGHVQNYIIKDKSFPAPIKMPLGGKRWRAKEVKAWARV